MRNWNSLSDSARITAGASLTDSAFKPRIAVGFDNAEYRAKEAIRNYIGGAGHWGATSAASTKSPKWIAYANTNHDH